MQAIPGAGFVGVRRGVLQCGRRETAAVKHLAVEGLSFACAQTLSVLGVGCDRRSISATASGSFT
jgi:hypothetical protein